MSGHVTIDAEMLEEVVIEALADMGGLVNLERDRRSRRRVTRVVLAAIHRAGWRVVRTSVNEPFQYVNITEEWSPALPSEGGDQP